MSAPKRYFVNKLSDFAGTLVQIPKERLKSRCLEYAHQIFSRQRVSPDDCDGGLYVGLAGVSYMFYYLSQHPEFHDEKQEFLTKASNYLVPSLNYIEHPQSRNDFSMQCSFILGKLGTYTVAAVLSNALGKRKDCDLYVRQYVEMCNKCLEPDFLGCGSDELFVGRAGYLCGILYLQKTLGQQILPDEKLFPICQAIVDSGTHYSRRMNSPCSLMYSYYNTEYLGAAHGLCSILQMLLSIPRYLEQNPDAEIKVKKAVDFLLGLQTQSGNFPCAMDEVRHPRSESNELVHWCHGAPGVVYLMAKAFLRWRDDKYLQSCLSCGEIVWKKGLLKKGPGICHGVAGNGYVFLLLYRLTNDKKHLHRALQFSNFLFEDEFKAARLPDRPLSLYEGLAGTVCFLADLLTPEKAHFPFFDVF